MSPTHATQIVCGNDQTRLIMSPPPLPTSGTSTTVVLVTQTTEHPSVQPLQHTTSLSALPTNNQSEVLSRPPSGAHSDSTSYRRDSFSSASEYLNTKYQVSGTPWDAHELEETEKPAEPQVTVTAIPEDSTPQATATTAEAQPAGSANVTRRKKTGKDKTAKDKTTKDKNRRKKSTDRTNVVLSNTPVPDSDNNNSTVTQPARPTITSLERGLPEGGHFTDNPPGTDESPMSAASGAAQPEPNEQQPPVLEPHSPDTRDTLALFDMLPFNESSYTEEDIFFDHL